MPKCLPIQKIEENSKINTSIGSELKNGKLIALMLWTGCPKRVFQYINQHGKQKLEDNILVE